MSGITYSKPNSDWSNLPFDNQEQILEMLKNDPKSIAMTGATCRTWKDNSDDWSASELRKTAVLKNGKLDLTRYPHINDNVICSLLASLKKAEVHLSTWDKLSNLFSSHPKKESLLVTSIDLTNCKNITDKTLQALEGFSITALRIQGCTKITIEGLKSLKKLPLDSLALDPRLKAKDFYPVKHIPNLFYC